MAASCSLQSGVMERRSIVLLDAAVPVLVGTVILIAALLDGGAQPLPLVLELAAALALLGRRRVPLATLGVSAVLVLVALHLDGRGATIAVLAPAVALFSLALTRSRRQQLAAGAVAVTLVVVADVLRQGDQGLVQTFGHVLLVSVPLLAAEALRTRRSYVALLVERLALAERSQEQEARRRVEQERMRIARDLHDIVAHTLTTINVQAATAAELIDRDPGYARAALATIEDASRDATAELRAVLGVLRDRDSPEAPRAPAPRLENLPDLVQRARDAGLDASLQITGEPPDRLLDAVSLAVYRIVQESLTNVHRHAPGAPVRIELRFAQDQLFVAVQNQAGTSGESGHDGDSGVGITGMTERVEALGGKLRAAPRSDGFCVDARLPYRPGYA